MKLSVDRTLKKARLALKKGDISQARQLCNEVLAAYPGNSRAQTALNSLKNAGPSGSRAPSPVAQNQLKTLISLFNQNQLGEVIELGEKLAPKSSQSFVVYNILGAANSRLKRTDKAIDCFTRAVQIKPDYSDAHTNLGNVLVDCGRQSEAVTCYEAALKFKPDDTDVHNNLGVALNDLGRYEKAVECFVRALKLKPRYAAAFFNLGLAQKHLDRHEEAIDSFNRSLQLNPNHAAAHNNLGIILQELGKYQDAVECFTRALSLNSDDFDAHNNLGVTFMMLEQHEEAIACYKRALKIKPDYVQAHNNLGFSLHQLGRIDEAIDSFTKALEYNPQDSEVRLKLGIVFNESNRLEEAADCFSKVLEARPDDADLRNNLGNLILRLYGFDNAIEFFREALSLDPNHKPALLNLCVCCVNSGEFVEANELLSRLYQLRPQAISVVKLFFKLPKDIVSLDFLTAVENCRKQDNETEQGCETEKAFLRAAILDRDCKYEEAWRFMTTANAQAYPENAEPFKRDAERWVADLEDVRRHTITDVDTVTSPTRSDWTIPLFVLGPSRAGKTTLETLVSNDSRIGRGYENGAVEASVIRASLGAGLGVIRSISDLPPSLLGSFAEDFRRRVEVAYEGKEAIAITNPGHIRSVGNLANALPEARFVFLTRNRDDTALRIFMNTYNEGNHHAYDIDAVYQYLEWYDTITDLLVAKLADRCVHLRYEDMVSEPGAGMEEVLKLCGLSVENIALPAVDSDVGAAKPYIEFIKEIRR